MGAMCEYDTTTGTRAPPKVKLVLRDGKVYEEPMESSDVCVPKCIGHVHYENVSVSHVVVSRG